MSVKIFACGDVVNSLGNVDWLSPGLIDAIKNADFAVANFEAPIQTDNMAPIPKAGPHLYQSAKSIECLKNAGFTHVSLANNHIYDFGELAFRNTVSALTDNGISYIGASFNFDDSYKPRIVEKDDLKIAIFAACENEFGCHYDEGLQRSGYAWLLHPRLDAEIKAVKASVDFVILIAHAGAENIPIPIKEWRQRYKVLCDLGVNVLIGHHPHVPQGVEVHNGSYIFYSLGNFYFDCVGFESKPDDSYSVLLEFFKNGQFTVGYIFHKKDNMTVSSVTESSVNFNFASLNKMLCDDYDRLNDEFSLDLFQSSYLNYYYNAVGLQPGFKGAIKYFIKSLLGKQNNNAAGRGLLLLHNIRIDTHRFVVQRALSLKYE